MMSQWSLFLVLLACTTPVICQLPHIQVQTGHTALIRSIDYNGAQKLCLTASNDQTLRLWSLSPERPGALLRVLAGHTSSVVGGLFNPNDESQVVSWSQDGTVRLWNLVSNTSMIVRTTDQPVCLDVRRGRNVLAVGTKGNKVELIDAKTGDLADKEVFVDFQPSLIQYSPSGEHLLIVGKEGRVAVYDIRNRMFLDQTNSFGAVAGVTWSSDDQWIVVGIDGTILTGHIGREITRTTLNVRVATVARHLDQQEVLLLGQDGTTIGYSLETKLKRVRGRSSSVRVQSSITIVHNNELLGGVELKSGGFAIEMYNWAGYSSIVADNMKSTIASAVVMLKQHRGLLVGGNDGTLWLWNPAASPSPIEVSANDFDRIETLEMLPDSMHCAVGGFGKQQLGILNLKTLDINWLPHRELASVRSMAVINQERLVVADGNSGRVTLVTTGGSILDSWDLKSRLVVKIDSNTFASVNERGVTIQELGTSVPRCHRAFATDEAIQTAAYDDERGRIVVVTKGGGTYSIVLDSAKGEFEREQQFYRLSSNRIPTAMTFMSKRAYALRADGEFCTRLPLSSDVDNCDQIFHCNARPTALAISADETLAAVATQDGTVLLVDLASMKSKAHLFASSRGWAAVSNNAEYTSHSDYFDAILVVRGFEVRTLRQMPFGYRNPSLVSEILNGREVIVDANNLQLGESFGNHPAVVTFVRQGSRHCSGENTVLTYRLTTGDNVIASVILTEGARIIYYRESDSLSRIGSAMRSIKAQLRPGRNTFMIHVKTIDGIVSTDTLTLESNDTLGKASRLYALIVGVNAYDSPLRNLEHAVDDALRMDRVLRKSNPASIITVLTESDATANRIRTSIVQLSELLRAQDRLLIYYAGHGLTTTDSLLGDHYDLLPHGSSLRHDLANTLPIDTLFADLNKVKASEILVVIDACQSGSIVGSSIVRHRISSSLLNGGGIAVIASTEKDEMAAEHSTLKGGLLTYLLAEGIGGMARDRDGDVTVYSLANYVAKKLSGLCEQYGLPPQRAVTRIGSSGASMILSN